MILSLWHTSETGGSGVSPEKFDLFKTLWVIYSQPFVIVCLSDDTYLCRFARHTIVGSLICAPICMFPIFIGIIPIPFVGILSCKRTCEDHMRICRGTSKKFSCNFCSRELCNKQCKSRKKLKNFF